jgi:hypothetical protein
MAKLLPLKQTVIFYQLRSYNQLNIYSKNISYFLNSCYSEGHRM